VTAHVSIDDGVLIVIQIPVDSTSIANVSKPSFSVSS